MSEEVVRVPLIGDQAPEFTAKTTQGEIHFPKDFEGSWVIFFSHPADFTPVCTTEFMAFASMQEAFGMLQPGASTTQAVRAVFFIDPKGIIRSILYYPLSNGRNMDEVMRLLIAMQTSDKYGVATPANWQPGDDVIVPSPLDHVALPKSGPKNQIRMCHIWTGSCR